jgi:hypothetical protein
MSAGMRAVRTTARPGMAGLTRCAGGKSHPPKDATHRRQCKCQREWERNVLPGQIAPSPSWRAASAGRASSPAWCRSQPPAGGQAYRAAALLYFAAVPGPRIAGSGFRIYLSDLGGATGIRTPDLLHAISRQHICSRPSTQVTVPGRAHESSGIRASCGTFLLYRAEPAPLRTPADTRPVESLRIYRADYRNHARHRHRKASKSSCNGRGANGRRPLRGSHRPVDSARTPARRTPTGACRQPLNARRGPG